MILAFGIGRGVVAGCAALGVGALCVYGSGLTQSVGVREKSMWVLIEVTECIYLFSYIFKIANLSAKNYTFLNVNISASTQFMNLRL